MQLLVTGGLGFIGSNFVRHILNTYPDYEVINLDAVTYAGHPENLQDIASHPGYKFVKGQIEDKVLVNKIVSGEMFGPINGVINFAAETHVDRSIHGPSVFVDTNIVGTMVLLDACYQHGRTRTTSSASTRTTSSALPASGASPMRFVQVSTDEVYGSLGDTGLFTERTPLAPNSPYSASKAGADMLCRSYFKTYGMPVAITRCSNNYGPYQHPEKLIPFFIMNILKNEKVPVYGDGMNVRDWLHVEDHCRAIDLVFHGSKPGEVYNIGGNNEKTNMELTRLILAKMGKGEEQIKYVTDRPGHDRRYAIDSSKIQKELGWTPKHTFETGIVETINWYLENTEWLNSVTGEFSAAPDLAKAHSDLAAAAAHRPSTTVSPAS